MANKKVAKSLTKAEKRKKSFEKFDSAARRGIAFLDKEQPGWEWKIELEKLNLRNIYSCVCGQLFGNFWDKVLRKGDVQQANEKISLDRAKRYGFYIDEEYDGTATYDMLTKVWYGLIKKLRKARLSAKF